jgi:hypothetical protein
VVIGKRPIRFWSLALACLGPWCATATAVEYLQVEINDTPREIAGRILVEAQDGGLLLEGFDQRWWVLQPEQIRQRRADDTPCGIEKN